MKINLETKKPIKRNLNGSVIVLSYQESEEYTQYFYCISNETHFYLFALNDSFVLDAEGDFNIDVSEKSCDMEILNAICDDQAYYILEIIPSEELELRRINGAVDEVPTPIREVPKYTISKDILSSVEKLCSCKENRNALYFQNNSIEDICVVEHYINEDYSCHLDVEWDNDGSESKLVVKLYIIKDGDVFTTITLDLSKVAHLSDLEIRKLMEESLNKIVEETEDED